MKTAAARFSALSVARNSVLEKAREASRLTIPGLIPEIGQNEHYSPTQPYQSAGAHGLRSLSARLLSTLFPTSVQFFRLELDAFAAAQLQADKNDVDTRLSQVAETTAAMMDDLKVRPALAEVIKQLIAAGNVVAYLPQDRAPLLKDSLMQNQLSAERTNLNAESQQRAAAAEANSMSSRIQSPTILGAGLRIATAGAQGYYGGKSIQLQQSAAAKGPN